MKLLITLLLALLLFGCGNSAMQREENRRQWQLTHNMNIIRVSHLDLDSLTQSITYTYYAPAYFWHKPTDSTFAFTYLVIDVRDSVIFLPTRMTFFKTFNRIDNPADYRFVMEDVNEYYKTGGKHGE